MTDNRPFSQRLDNARSHCQQPLPRAIVEIIADYATNPFIIYRQDYLPEPELAAELRREFQFSDQQLKETLQTMIDQGVIARRRRLFSGTSYSVTAAAIDQPAQ